MGGTQIKSITALSALAKSLLSGKGRCAQENLFMPEGWGGSFQALCRLASSFYNQGHK